MITGTVPPLRPPVHLLGAHIEDTLANLNAIVSDANLDDSGASRPPTAHTLNSHSAPDGKVAFAGKEAGDIVLENLAAKPAVPVLGKIYFKSGDLHPWVCTAIE